MTTAVGAATHHCLRDNNFIRNLRFRLTEMPAPVSTAGPGRRLHLQDRKNEPPSEDSPEPAADPPGDWQVVGATPSGCRPQAGRLGWAAAAKRGNAPGKEAVSKVSPDEFTEFYAASFRRLVGQLYAMTGDTAEAQDAVQEAFVRAWTHRRRLDADGSPEAWVRATAWRIAVSRWHRARIGRRLLSSQPSPSAADGPGPDRVALVDALRKLPAEQRRAVVLYHLCDLSVAQIAAETGAPVGTVKARLARGRAALAPYLRDTAASSASPRGERG